MSFPLFTETYTIGKRRYRRPPYKANSKKSNLVVDTGDTPDLYADEHEDGPSCHTDYAPTVDFQEVEEELPISQETRKEDKASTKSKEKRAEPKNEEAGEICPEDARITCYKGKLTASIAVPSQLVSHIIGTRGVARRELEESTGCRLTIPRRGEKGPVVVKSFESLENVQRCLERIELIVEKGRQTLRYTHFVAIPCTHPDIVDSYILFREAVVNCEQVSSCAKDSSLFSLPSRLHLTVSMLWLLDEKDEEKARKAMQTAEKQINAYLESSGPLIADIQGIGIMNDDPSNTHVLYAKVEGESLQSVSRFLLSPLQLEGLCPCEKEEKDILFHLTLMNSRHTAESSGQKRNSFDATHILEEYGDYYFGTIPIQKISICCLNSKSPESEYYEELCEIQLFKN